MRYQWSHPGLGGSSITYQKYITLVTADLVYDGTMPYGKETQKDMYFTKKGTVIIQQPHQDSQASTRNTRL